MTLKDDVVDTQTVGHSRIQDIPKALFHNDLDSRLSTLNPQPSNLDRHLLDDLLRQP